MPPQSYLVYEVVNPVERKAVIGVSSAADLEALKSEHRRLPPVWVARWAGREIAYRVVEAGLARHEAMELAAKYAGAAIWKDFQVELAG